MKKINFKKIISSRSTYLMLFILAVIFLFGKPAFADLSETLGNVVGSVIAIFIRAISSILILIVGVLMNVATYSDFINAPAVSKGWVVVRDLCNMFFVVILLIIAFATILGQEEYGAKKMLPKLIMAAVLINFSKLFCGLMIDISNVVMLTFVNAFSAIGAGNILDMLGIADVTKIAVTSDSGAITFGMIVSSYIFGLIYVVIATVVVAAMLAMLVVRLVMIWILVVLSPLAFFLQAVPGKGATYAGQWWNKWTSNLLVGPIIAFFLWLSFAALQNSGSPLVATDNGDLAANNSNISSATSTGGMATQAGTPAAMAKFVIAIGMLLGGMKIAQSVGEEAGGAMSKVFSKGKGLATAAGIGALAMSGKAVGRGARNVALTGAGKLANLASEKDIVTGKRAGTKVGNFALQWKDDLVDSRKKEKVASREKFLKKVGMGEKTAEKGIELIKNDTMQKVGRASRGAANYASAGALAGTVLGPIGSYVGGAIGGSIGLVTGAVGGYASKSKYDKAKADIKDYQQKDASGVSEQSKDEIHTNSIKSKMAAAKAAGVAFKFKDDTTPDEKAALKRARQNEKNKKIVDGKDALGATTGGPTAFERTNKAMDNMTKKQQAAKDWVKIASNNDDTLEDMGKGNVYSSSGISETWKKRLEELNKGGGDADQAIDKMSTEITTPGKLTDKQLTEVAKVISAYEKKGGVSNSATLGKLKAALITNDPQYNPDNFTDKVTAQYKQAGAGMEVKAGSGGLQYNTFAKNSAKAPTDRKASKDIMGASFDKINNKAKELGVDYKLDSAAGVNQKVEGAQLSNLSKVMSGLIDDEIKSLQAVGGNINSQKISELNAAKTRLDKGDISGLSLKNTDVSYSGATDTEKRQAEYNTTQHEIMHQSGAKNEELVNDSANVLQESKLIGRVPQSDPESGGKRYDEVIGKMIANMEQANANPDEIRSAIDAQISKWAPNNAKRVIETENGERDTIKDTIIDTSKEPVDTEKVISAIDKLTESLSKPLKIAGGNNQGGKIGLDIPTSNFFRRMFGGIKESVSKGDESIGEKLKPLSAMAVSEEVNKVDKAA